MSKYNFVKRQPDGSEEIVTILTIEDGQASWEGNSYIRDLLHEEVFSLLGFKPFDETNPDHIEMLPVLVSGSRLWVVKEE